MTTVHQRQVVVLSPCGDSDNDASALSVQLESVAARIKGLDASWQVSFAVSDRVDSFDAVPAAFNEARLALEVGRSIGREAAVFRVGGLGAYRFILQATTATQAMAFRDAVLGPVERHDAGQGAQLLHTLLVYIRHGMSVKGTAAALAVHPHTVQYRLRRLEDLTNLDLSRAEDRLTLELAARLHNLAQD